MPLKGLQTIIQVPSLALISWEITPILSTFSTGTAFKSESQFNEAPRSAFQARHTSRQTLGQNYINSKHGKHRQRPLEATQGQKNYKHSFSLYKRIQSYFVWFFIWKTATYGDEFEVLYFENVNTFSSSVM